jgi:uncharacterized OB-fold protein
MVICHECGAAASPGNNFCIQCGAAAAAVQEPTCSLCGGRTRLGSLHGETELTMLFQDSDEERFVQALVCVDCRVVKLKVDYDTEVED